MSARDTKRVQKQRPLSKRELEVTQLIAEGMSTKQIANVLGLTEMTITTYRANIFHAIGVNSAIKLVVYALRNELVMIPGIKGESR